MRNDGNTVDKQKRKYYHKHRYHAVPYFYKISLECALTQFIEYKQNRTAADKRYDFCKYRHTTAVFIFYHTERIRSCAYYSERYAKKPPCERHDLNPEGCRQKYCGAGKNQPQPNLSYSLFNKGISTIITIASDIYHHVELKCRSAEQLGKAEKINQHFPCRKYTAFARKRL